MIDRTIDGTYKIYDEVGSGGFSTVYLARNVHTNEVVAIKVMHARLADDPKQRERFRREARAAEAVDSPHIVKVLDHGQVDGRPYLVMEYVDGKTLIDVIREHATVPVGVAVQITRELGEALEAIHEAGLVHRDLKPHNVMVTPGGRVKLMDLGIAKDVTMQTITQTGTYVGTPAYMSPEQIRGQGVDIRSDIYALGIVLYQMLTGRVPFDADSPWVVMRKHLEEPVPLGPLRQRGVPSWVISALQRMLEKSPAKRLQTPSDISHALVLQEKEATIPLSGSLPGGSGSDDGRLPSWVPFVGIGALLISGFLFLLAGVGVPAPPNQGTSHVATVSATAGTGVAAMTARSTAMPAPEATGTPTSTATSSSTPTNSPTQTATPVPTNAPTRVPTKTPTHTPTHTPRPPTHTPTSLPVPTSTPTVSQSRIPRLMLGNYFAWYSDYQWDDCNISAGDKPLQPYNSDDPATIARHIQMARGVGLDGFTLHWFAPGERTDRNFETLLNQSQGQDFHSTVVFSNHFWPGALPTKGSLVKALRYIIDRYGSHPNFLKLEGKPVIFFTDVYRVPTEGSPTPQQAWADIRAQVDPNHDTWWIAEGLEASYLTVFDGLYVYKITHADYPNDYVKASRWAGNVRRWEQKTGRRKLWIGTLSPGWDDLRSTCKEDVRVASPPHKQDRKDGTFYQATFDAAMQSNPDWLWIHSFNEWVEGTYIEPSELYGEKYMNMTRQFSQQFKR